MPRRGELPGDLKRMEPTKERKHKTSRFSLDFSSFGFLHFVRRTPVKYLFAQRAASLSFAIEMGIKEVYVYKLNIKGLVASARGSPRSRPILCQSCRIGRSRGRVCERKTEAERSEVKQKKKVLERGKASVMGRTTGGGGKGRGVC